MVPSPLPECTSAVVAVVAVMLVSVGWRLVGWRLVGGGVVGWVVVLDAPFKTSIKLLAR